MKTTIVLFFSFLFATTAMAQREFPIRIQNFSENYYALIAENDAPYIDSVSGQEIPYIIKVLNKRSNKTLIKAGTAYFPDYLMDENKEAIPNIHELPYGSQSVLLYEDYNFDGIKDFALMNGNNSCYGGPSFDIYLADKAGGFMRSESFSDLSNNYCGMFQVDDESKTISTMTKSGCCWHEYSEFRVIDNEPRPIKVVVEDATGMQPFLLRITTSEWQNNKELKTEKLYPPYDGLAVCYSFELEKNDKKVLLFEEDSTLYYALQLPDESIEFHYPQPVYDETTGETAYGNFQYDEGQNTLTFHHKDATYHIYETREELGILVIIKGKDYHLKGRRSTLNGKLESMKTQQWNNVHY